MVPEPSSLSEGTPRWYAYLCAWGGGAFGVCTETLDYAWFLRKPGALDEYIIALDENGHLIVEGEVHENKTVANHLSTYAVSGSVVWQAKDTGGTQLAAVYQNNTTDRFDLVLAGSLVESANFGTYSGVTNRLKVTKDSSSLMELKTTGGGLNDGSLLIACTKEENRPVGFIQERWDSPEAMATPLYHPNHFTFIPGMGNAMLVTERTNRKVRVIEDDGTLKKDPIADLTQLISVPAGQHGLLGIACHPDFDDAVSPKRFVYVFGTSNTPTLFPNDPYRPNVETWVNKIYRFEVNAELTPIATPAPVSGGPDVYAGNTTPTPVFTPVFEEVDHTGGCLRSYSDGSDDYLLLSTGCIDHERNAGYMSGRPQDVRVYPGKLLRYKIASNGNLEIPSDNPFTGWLTATPTAVPAGTPTPASYSQRLPKAEIVASGFRNPYTFALRPDPNTGAIIEAWIANVGGVEERGFEEIDRVDLSFSGGPDISDYENFGFPRVEGNSAQPTPWPTPGYQMYTGCNSGCDPENYGGDLFERPSFPYVPFANLTPPTVYYLRPSGSGSVGGPAFITGGFFPSDYEDDLVFLDFVHGTIGRVPDDQFSSAPLLLNDSQRIWWDSEQPGMNYELQQGPDGNLYYLWYSFAGSVGGINRLSFRRED
ncbi:MAG: hypothetical protein GHCLOJNM_01840 [bacterium]|nr:hypothetical protein [bacterium]